MSSRGEQVLDGPRLTAVRQRVRWSSGADAALSRVNRLAAELLGVPVSLLSLVDEDRQVFVGRHGLPEAWDRAGATPLSHSICQHVVATDAPVIIEDVREDPLADGNLAPRDLDVVAYAGVPLRDAEGRTLGSFCVIDGVPRAWGRRDLEILEDLAALALDQLELLELREKRTGSDHLTGLMTREVFEQLVEYSLTTTRHTSVLAFGLDGFRLVNEALGHSFGDQLLVGVANRLAEAVRASDVVCRLAGDEFLVLCEAAEDEAEALRTADRLRGVIGGAPYDLAGHPQKTSVSVGVASTSESIGADELIETACGALRRAKDGVNRRVQTAAPRLSRRAGSRLRLRSAIAGAHERGELHLAYQPIVDLRTRDVVALEALMRWTHPELGRIGPDEFIPAAELSGAIVPLGEWALQQACTDVAGWRRLPGREALVVGVNVAPIQLTVPSFPDVVASTLAAANLDPSALNLEVTERTLLADGDTQRRSLEELHDAGVTISIDDFGTGYSALGYLTRFPVDVVKIDGSFIERMHADSRSSSLVSGILGLAEGLDLETVAEGVEHEDQVDSLREAGFRWAQGYLFARPMPAAELTATLRPGAAPA